MATSLRRYNTTILKPGYYYIVTDNDIEYVCFFAAFDYMFAAYPIIAPKVFAFNIELLNKDDINKQKGIDKRLAFTVIHIVAEVKGGTHFSIEVIPNFEMERELIGFGEGIKILSFNNIVRKVKKKVKLMHALYETEAGHTTALKL